MATSKTETKKPKKKKKAPEKELHTFDTGIVFAVDSSFRCPGFAVVGVHEHKIVYVWKDHLDNHVTKDLKLADEQVIARIYDYLRDKCVLQMSLAQQSISSAAHKITIPEVHYVREAAFNSRGSQSEIQIFKVIGILDLFAAKQRLAFDEIYPVTVKKQVTSNARAEKTEVASALKDYFGDLEYATDDESDALAVALAWLLKNKVIEPIKKDDDNATLD